MSRHVSVSTGGYEYDEEEFQVGTYCYIEGSRDMYGIIQKCCPHNQYRIIDLFENRSRLIRENRLEIITKKSHLKAAKNLHQQYLKNKAAASQDQNSNKKKQQTSRKPKAKKSKPYKPPKTSDDQYVFITNAIMMSMNSIITCCFTIYFVVAIVSPIIGIVSFQDQYAVWSKYSSGFNDAELVNEQCNDSYDKFSRLAVSSRGNETENDPGTKSNDFLTLYWCQLIYAIVFMILHITKRICISKDLFWADSCDNSRAAIVIEVCGPTILLIMWITECVNITWYLTWMVDGIEEYCDVNSEIYYTFIIDNKDIVFALCIIAYVKILSWTGICCLCLKTQGFCD